MRSKRTAGRRLGLVVAAAVVVLFCAMPAAATAAPAWDLTTTYTPTTFQRGDVGVKYVVVMKNVGTTATVGTDFAEFTSVMPAGVTPRSLTTAPSTGWTCDPLPAVHCVRSVTANLNANASYTFTITASVGQNTPDTAAHQMTAAHGGAPTVTRTDNIPVVARPDFGISSFTTSVKDAGGTELTQAGGHPYTANATFTLPMYTNELSEQEPIENVRDVKVDLPPGFVGNPATTPRCKLENFLNIGFGQAPCPIESAVGIIELYLGGGDVPSVTPVYNVIPEKGNAAEFGYVFVPILGASGTIYAKVRSDGDYGLQIRSNVPKAGLRKLSTTFCGYGVTQGGTIFAPTYSCKLPTDPGATLPFLSNPTDCDAPAPTTYLSLNSWEHPGTWKDASFQSPDLEHCDGLTFDPTISVTPATTQADTPSGYDVHVGVPQPNTADTLATPPLRNATVTLPDGVSLSPSTADGLEGCTDDEFKEGSLAAATCPDASKIGTVHIATPVLPTDDDTDYIAGGVNYQLSGAIYLRKPDPGATRESLYTIFLDIEDEKTGIVVKLRGKTVPDENGTLTARFVDNPQLPFTDFLLKFKGGSRAPLTNPLTCGTKTTQATFTSWGGPTGQPTSSFVTDWDGQGGACPDTLPFTPSYSAGTVDPLAGAFSPFTMTIKRDDRQQILNGIDVDMPSGLLGMIGSVPLCGDEQAAAGTCGDESQIGSTTVSAGAGANPFSLPGKVFVAGPYKGQPFSLSIVVRAIAGPFDLGTVVVRAPIMVDAANAKLRVPSDALPTILEGVPLRLRMINILLDRPGFMFNATNCGPQQVGANLSSPQGAVASVSSPYQPSGCANLPFHPSFKATSNGKLKFKNGAALRVDITQQPGESAIKSVAVTLPKQLPSRLIPTINNACVQDVFENDPANCPEDSYVGTVTAKTPVFPDPLVGPVYVIARAKEVPQVVAVLRGQGIAKGIDLKLYGDIIIDSGGGRSKSTFNMVPDVPISSFTMNLPAGPHSILDAPTYDVCQGPLKIGVNIIAQNGKRQDSNETVKVEDCPKIPGPKVLATWVTKKGIAVKTLVPSLGRLAVSGTGLIPVARKAVKRGLITANVPYTPAMRKAVQKGAKKLRVKVWFQPNNAAKPSTKTITVKVKQRKPRR